MRLPGCLAARAVLRGNDGPRLSPSKSEKVAPEDSAGKAESHPHVPQVIDKRREAGIAFHTHHCL